MAKSSADIFQDVRTKLPDHLKESLDIAFTSGQGVKITKNMIANNPTEARRQAQIRIGNALFNGYQYLMSKNRLEEFEWYVKTIGDPDPKRFLRCQGAHSFGSFCVDCFFSICRFCNSSNDRFGWESCLNPTCVAKSDEERARVAAQVKISQTDLAFHIAFD
jgi:hypothetical protein